MRLSLAGRLCGFFLAALAAVLIGFSTALFLLAQAYLHRRDEARLAAALETLIAAAEVEDEGVSWEPAERRLTLGLDPAADQVRWLIRDEAHRVVDRSANSRSVGQPRDWRAGPEPPGKDLGPWRFDRRDLRPARRADGKGLTVLVALSRQPAMESLGMLIPSLVALSAGLWLVAAVAGRRLARHALAPLTRLAEEARSMTADDLGRRLPAPGTGDELDDLGLAFNDLLGRLHESFERQKRFTGDASHQLRTPLAALLGQVEVALRRDRPPEEYRRVLVLVRGRAEHLRQIIDSLLYLARAEAEAGPPALESLDLAAWLTDHLRSWSEHPRAADLREAPTPRGPACVKVHRPLLAQALDNLIDNACHSSEPGTPVIVGVSRAAGRVALAVEDRGQGVDAADLPHLFEPFYRSPRARRGGRSGVGLGLAVARRIVEAFGGSIRVEGTKDPGSRFVIELPGSTPGEVRACDGLDGDHRGGCNGLGDDPPRASYDPGVPKE